MPGIVRRTVVRPRTALVGDYHSAPFPDEETEVQICWGHSERQSRAWSPDRLSWSLCTQERASLSARLAHPLPSSHLGPDVSQALEPGRAKALVPSRSPVPDPPTLPRLSSMSHESSQ